MPSHLTSLFFKYLFTYACELLCVSQGACGSQRTSCSVLFSSFYSVDSRDQTQVGRLYCQHSATATSIKRLCRGMIGQACHSRSQEPELIENMKHFMDSLEQTPLCSALHGSSFRTVLPRPPRNCIFLYIAGCVNR